MKRETREAIYSWMRLSGMPGERTDYVVTIEDNCQKDSCDHLLPTGAPDHDDPLQCVPEVYLFSSSEEALRLLSERYGTHPPCPEHSRILIWKILPSGHRQIVWHFSGRCYHYPMYTDLNQGTLPGDSEPLYYRALDHYYTDLAVEYYVEE